VALPEEFHEIARKVRNWGRWGDDDEIGTMNLVTDDVVRRATACVRTGRRFSLALPLSGDGPQIGTVPGRINPLHTMIAINSPYVDPEGFRTSDDVLVMATQAATHWDALAHASYGGTIYNGFPAESITAEQGATRCGVDKIPHLVTRGVLLDVARAKGVDRLEGGYALTPDDLDAAAELARLDVQPGDVVLLRTGQMQLLFAGDKLGYCIPNPGPSMQTVEWFRSHDVAAVATDSYTYEVFPPEREDCALPVHLLHLVDMGMTQGQHFVLESLAADCADDGVYEFLLEASPQPIVGGTGTPVNPVAVK
jgi:kynurenine formamidase